MNSIPYLAHKTNTLELPTNYNLSPPPNPLHKCVTEMLDNYFKDMDGHKSENLYDLVISEVEQPLLKSVLSHVRGNQSKAAELLGINRGTLRKKLNKYGL